MHLTRRDTRYRAMSISLTPEQEDFVKRRMSNGNYDAPRQVIDTAFQLLKEQEELDRIRIEELRKEIALGLEQEAQGLEGPLDMEEIKAASRERAAQLRGSE